MAKQKVLSFVKSKKGMTIPEVLIASLIAVAVVGAFGSLFYQGQKESAGAMDRMSERVERNSLFEIVQKTFFSNDIQVIFSSVHPTEYGAIARFPVFLNGVAPRISYSLSPHYLPGVITTLFPKVERHGIATVCTIKPSEYMAFAKTKKDIFEKESEAEKLEASSPNLRVLIFQTSKTDFGYSALVDSSGQV